MSQWCWDNNKMKSHTRMNNYKKSIWNIRSYSEKLSKRKLWNKILNLLTRRNSYSNRWLYNKFNNRIIRLNLPIKWNEKGKMDFSSKFRLRLSRALNIQIKMNMILMSGQVNNHIFRSLSELLNKHKNLKLIWT